MRIFSRLILSLFILSVFCQKCSPILAQTTIYTGSLEKNLDSGEIKLTIPAGTETAIKTIKSDGSSSVVYVHADHLGSTALITDNSGSQIASIQYYPYGATYNLQPTTYNLQPTTDRLYTNQRQDKDTDLYFYNARYYNPAIGRFLSADKAEGPNRYAYVSNNPVMRNDPSGNEGRIGMADFKKHEYKNGGKFFREQISPLGATNNLDIEFNKQLLDQINNTKKKVSNDSRVKHAYLYSKDKKSLQEELLPILSDIINNQITYNPKIGSQDLDIQSEGWNWGAPNILRTHSEKTQGGVKISDICSKKYQQR